MSDRADHLIERAAARMRLAGAGQGGVATQDHARPAPLDSAGPALFKPFLLPRVGEAPAAPAAPADPAPGDAAIEREADGLAATPASAPVSLDALRRAGMIGAGRTRISEEYRIVSARLARRLEGEGTSGALANVVMVTSARPGEGKSFTALNLAASVARNGGRPALLVDADPKAGSLSETVGLASAPGFADLAADPSRRPGDLALRTEIAELSLMPVGGQSDAGGPGGERLGLALTRLAQAFPGHLVLLDAPPCLSTSDPHVMAAYAGLVVLVVEAERTQRAEVEAAADLVSACPKVTTLLNKQRSTASHTFGAYGYPGASS